MILHKSPQEFKDAIEAAAQHLGMRPVFVEKDYWVCYVLKNLANSEYVDRVVFKGGTSLSKAYSCIERFSEDIDLAIISPNDYNGNQLKALLKKVSEKITEGLKNIPGYPSENKLGKIRATAYEYEKVIDETNFGVVKDYILVEINCFANPVPHNTRSIQTYIAQFFNETNNAGLIEEYKMQSFNVEVLSLQRTYFEKVLSVNRLSYDAVEAIQEKVRHFYDIHQLHSHPELKDKILTAEYFEIISNVRSDDEANRTMDGKWKGQLIASSPLFSNLEQTWQQVSGSYKTGLADLIWSKQMPSTEDVLLVLKEVKECVNQFDKQYPPSQIPPTE